MGCQNTQVVKLGDEVAIQGVDLRYVKRCSDSQCGSDIHAQIRAGDMEGLLTIAGLPDLHR